MVGEPRPCDAAHELILTRDAVSIKQRAQRVLLGDVGVVDRRRDLDREPEDAEQLDPVACAVEAARAAMGVVQPGTCGVQ